MDEKLLICLAIILFLTIVWTITVGILYRMYEKNRTTYESKIDEDKLVVTRRVKKESKNEKKEIVKVKEEPTKKEKESKVARKLETYVKVKFHGSKRIFIYVVPPKLVLVEKQKIKVRIDEDTVRSATVIKGNYTREKYKSFEYKTIEVVEK